MQITVLDIETGLPLPNYYVTDATDGASGGVTDSEGKVTVVPTPAADGSNAFVVGGSLVTFLSAQVTALTIWAKRRAAPAPGNPTSADGGAYLLVASVRLRGDVPRSRADAWTAFKKYRGDPPPYVWPPNTQNNPAPAAPPGKYLTVPGPQPLEKFLSLVPLLFPELTSPLPPPSDPVSPPPLARRSGRPELLGD